MRTLCAGDVLYSPTGCELAIVAMNSDSAVFIIAEYPGMFNYPADEMPAFLAGAGFAIEHN
jgi:hypothetical protein